MLDSYLHVHTEAIHRELREIALQRPRLDRPDERRRGRLRGLLYALALAPTRAARGPEGAGVPRVTIRPARASDLGDLTRLAEISERRVPSGLVLVAEVDSDVIAALPVDGGPTLSDLWRPTGDVAQLLELRSRQVRAAELESAA